MQIEKIKIQEINSLVITLEEDNTTVISYDGLGGSIISHKNRQEAERIFIEAMDLAISVNKLLYFKQFGKFPCIN